MMFKILLHDSREVLWCYLLWLALEPDLVDIFVEPDTGIDEIDPVDKTEALYVVETQDQT